MLFLYSIVYKLQSCVLINRVKFGVPLATTLVAGQLPEALVVCNVIC